MTKTANHMNSYRKEQSMEKELVIKWLQECSDEGSGESCNDCPCVNCNDCAGELMRQAAAVLGDQEG